MKGTLKKKTTREVHGRKIMRLRIDIPFNRVENEGGEGQDVAEFLDHKVGDEIRFELLPFNDEDQTEIEELLESSDVHTEAKPGEEERNLY